MIYDAGQGRIRIALAGDAMITRPLRPYREPHYLALRDRLHTAHARIANLEMLFHDYTPAPAHVSGGTYMYAEATLIAELEWLGINAVTTANNHAYDFGEAGLLQNLEHLRASSLTHVGIGEDLAAARSAAFLDTAAGRVAILGVTSSGQPAMAAEHRWRDGPGRPGVNMLRYTTEYTVPRPIFNSLRELRDGLDLFGLTQRSEHYRWADLSYGLSESPESDDAFYLADLTNRWQYPVPNGVRFRSGRDYSRRYVPVAQDVDEILARVADARRMADWVVVSMHNHESGPTDDDPSSMITEFARKCIDSGADVFHGHGPHRDRAIEIYRDRPIFYSIGHLIVQNDTVTRVARENILRQGLDPWEALPSDFVDARSGKDRDGELVRTSAQIHRWRDFVGFIEFDQWELSSITLQPIDLGFGLPRPQRGRPVLASQDVAEEVVRLLQRLSAPYGTAIEFVDGIGRLTLRR